MVWLRLTLLSLRWHTAIFQNEKGVSEVRQICVFLPVSHNACLSSVFFFTKPDAMLTRIRIPSAARDFSPRVNFQCRLSYGVRTTPVCNRMHQHLCALKIPNTGSHILQHCLDTQTLAAIYYSIVWTHRNYTQC